MDNPNKKLSPKQFALRAARAATLGLVISAGCYQSTGESIHLAEGTDAGFDVADSNTTDSNMADTTGDALNCRESQDWVLCCDEVGWDPQAGCSAWGPYVPPAFGAVPPSRSVLG